MAGLDDNTKLLLHLDGTDKLKSAYAQYKMNAGAASTTVTDSGSGANNGTSSTNMVNLTSAGKIENGKIGNAAYFVSNGYANASDHADFNLGSGDFTLEFWIKPTSITNYAYAFGQDDAAGSYTGSSFSMGHTDNGYPVIRLYYNGNNTVAVTGTTSLAIGEWQHLAAVRNSNTLSLYVDGVSVGTPADVTGYTVNNSAANIGIGRPGSWANWYFTGWMDEVRMSNTARYTTGFTPSTTAFSNDGNTKLLLHLDGNLTDSSTTGHSFTNNGAGLGAFDFTRTSSEFININALEVDVSSDTVGSIACWINPDDLTQSFVWAFGDTNLDWYLFCRLKATGYLSIIMSAGTSVWDITTTTTQISAGNWYHVVLVQNGTAPKVYVNDTLQSVTYGTSPLKGKWLAHIGSNVDNGRIGCAAFSSVQYDYWDGKIDDWRYYKYPMSAADVTTLYNSGNGTEGSLITDAAERHTGAVSYVTAEYDAHPLSDGVSVAEFNGSSAYLSIPDSADWDIAGSLVDSWTVDLWVNVDVSGTYNLICHREDGSNQWHFTWVGGVEWGMRITSGGVEVANCIESDTSSFVPGVWYHIAACKVADDWGLYKDGVQVAYKQQSGTDTFSAALEVGRLGSLGRYWNGNICEVRIQNSNAFSATPVVGLTDTITVPTTQHTSDANTKLLLHFDNFVDDGNTGHAVQNVSNNATLYSPSKFGNSAIIFDGDSDYIQIPNSPDFDIVADNWIMDFQIRFDTHSGIEVVALNYQDASNYWRLYHTGGGSGWNFTLFIAASNDIIMSAAAGAIQDSLWHHVAVIRNGDAFGIYVDGLQVDYDYNDASSVTTYTSDLLIGKKQNNVQYVDGSVDEFRFQHSDYFSTMPLPEPYAWYRLNEIKASNTSVRDDGSGANDGTSSTNTPNLVTQGKVIGQLGTAGHTNGTDPNGTTECSAPNHTSLDLSSSTDWTIEMRIQWHQSAANCYWMLGRWDSSNRSWWMNMSNGTTSNGKLAFAYTTDGSSNVNVYFGEANGAFVPTLEKWYHVAMVRTGGYIYAYIDGKLYGTPHYIGTTTFYGGTSATRFPSSLTTYGASTHCSFEEVRVSKGIARWTEEFDVPTTQYTSDANTSLLCHMDGNATDSSSNSHTITTTDVGFGAYDFDDASSEYINIDALRTDIISDTTGTFALWFKVDDLSALQYLWCFGDTNSGEYISLAVNTSGELEFHTSIGGWQAKGDDTTVSAGTWYHVVCGQNGTAAFMYVNGSSESLTFSFQTNADRWFSSYSGFIDNGRIGCRNYQNSTNQDFLDGKVEDFRYYQNTVLTADQVGQIYNADDGLSTPQDVFDPPTAEYGEDVGVGYSQGIIIV